MARKLPNKYWQAITWIASNDDTQWLDDEFGSPSVTLSLVADLFNVKSELAIVHLRKAVKLRDELNKGK